MVKGSRTWRPMLLARVFGGREGKGGWVGKLGMRCDGAGCHGVARSDQRRADWQSRNAARESRVEVEVKVCELETSGPKEACAKQQRANAGTDGEGRGLAT
jgi:hypothetical protein